MKRVEIIAVIMACVLLSGCEMLGRRHREAGAVVALGDTYIYQSELDSLTMGLNSEDSIRVAQQYIRQWAQDGLMYREAQSAEHKMQNVGYREQSADIERLVNEYREALYVRAYEQYLVERRMSKVIADSMIYQLYEQLSDRFLLKESIAKGLLLVVPNDAPNIATLRKWVMKVKDGGLEDNGEALDNIEKYAYQNASGYELFLDKWLTTTELLAHMPAEREDLEKQLRQKDEIEIRDSLNTYIIRITGKHLQGSLMPVEYAKPEIEQLILSRRQVEFLQKERERLYNEAIQDKKLVFYN